MWDALGLPVACRKAGRRDAAPAGRPSVLSLPPGWVPGSPPCLGFFILKLARESVSQRCDAMKPATDLEHSTEMLGERGWCAAVRAVWVTHPSVPSPAPLLLHRLRELAGWGGIAGVLARDAELALPAPPACSPVHRGQAWARPSSLPYPPLVLFLPPQSLGICFSPGCCGRSWAGV